MPLNETIRRRDAKDRGNRLVHTGANIFDTYIVQLESSRILVFLYLITKGHVYVLRIQCLFLMQRE